MKIKFKFLIECLLLIFVFFVCLEVCGQDNCIWKLGSDEAPQDYSNSSFDKFDQSDFDPNYYADTEPVSEFPREINDGALQQIYINYTLSSEEAGKDISLFLDTLYAAHVDNNTGKLIPYYNLRIKVGSNKDNLTSIGEYKFGSADSEYPESQNITISKKYLNIGKNIILLENANPEWSGHWMMWDSLELRTSNQTLNTLSGEREVIWEIDESEKFDSNIAWPAHYYADYANVNYGIFPADLNDGYQNRTQIYIHYTLNSTQVKEDMELTLCIAMLSANKSFRFGVSVNNNTIGNYFFTSQDSCKNINISGNFNRQGENVLLIENNNPSFTGHWITWKSLSLTSLTNKTDYLWMILLILAIFVLALILVIVIKKFIITKKLKNYVRTEEKADLTTFTGIVNYLEPEEGTLEINLPEYAPAQFNVEEQVNKMKRVFDVSKKLRDKLNDEVNISILTKILIRFAPLPSTQWISYKDAEYKLKKWEKLLDENQEITKSVLEQALFKDGRLDNEKIKEYYPQDRIGGGVVIRFRKILDALKKENATKEVKKSSNFFGDLGGSYVNDMTYVYLRYENLTYKKQ